MRKKGRLLTRIGIPVASLTMGLVLPIFSLTVFAGYATSSTGYFTVNSKNYSNNSVIATDTINGTSFANSWSTVQTYPASSSNNVPAGYMGSKARLFNGNDELIAETSWVYNDKTTYVLDSRIATRKPAVSRTAYYGYGITAAYNGNGYSQYYTFKSPKQNG
ncbi:hypothetical protein [Paenibacillus assamensis]|uniref:hypothetical protein n=1 Tax=Paenibacillus assamensis TaxID=311244 RepID=UPI00048CFB50|nr:hypothetical protein [Paenibacillus assamensis]